MKKFWISLSFLVAFLVWTLAVSFVDLRLIGPLESVVGFGGMNGFVHELTGVHVGLYVLTDWLSLIPLAIAAGFGILGLVQLLKRKSLFAVDKSILVLGGFYIAVMFAFILFENVIINYRPVLIEGVLEASYPSSTTMLVICVMSTALMQFDERIKNCILKRIIKILIVLFIAFMVIGRFVSGVHWFSDIIGGILLSAGLVVMYKHFAS